MRLEGKVAIVTGAAHGMGASHALALAREGADVAVTDITSEKSTASYSLGKDFAPSFGTENEATSVVDQIKAMGRRAIFVQCDVSEASQVEAMVNRVIDEFGKIDILVNNAGVCIFGVPLWEQTEEQWDAQVNVILKGAFLCCKHVIPHMLKQGHGKIINIGSSGTRRGGPGMATYAAAKVGVQNLTYEIAADLSAYAQNYNITVNCVAPGLVQTPMVREVFKPLAAKAGMTEDELTQAWVDSALLRRPVQEQDVSYAVVFLASDEAKNINGIVLPVDGGMLPG